MRRVRLAWSRGIRQAAVVLAVALAWAGAVAPAPVAEASTGEIIFNGRGWGHGRGMGQYGAFGYAVDHGWSSDQILAHFYGGTTLARDGGNPQLTVELTALTGRDTIVIGPGLWVNGELTGSAAVRVHRLGGGAFQLFTGPTCGGPWTAWRVHGSGLTIGSAADTTQQAQMLRVCESSGSRAYRGRFQVVEAGDRAYTFNEVAVDDYLRGVVPRESPASWGLAGSGRGMQALRAQAVAARSYALSGTRRPSGAWTCDTESCQVYGGSALVSGTGTITSLEAATTDQAVLGTSGQVMRHGSGAVARTEFSSSTGGWTAGGTFPAVRDDGDDTQSNPNHVWTQTIAASTVGERLGTGAIRTITVTGRNGLGADGGRVTELTVVGTDGRTTRFTGSQARVRLGLKSDWFTIDLAGAGPAEAVVTALYVDLLGRLPDPSGLATFSAAVRSTGSAAGTARTLAYSTERLRTLVSVQYRSALRREPDPVGIAFWTDQLQRGMSIHQLQSGIYGSPEGVAVLGGGDLRRWVGQLYLELLGRPASESDVTLWADHARRNGPSSAVQGIVGSPESAMRTVSSYYQRMLGRFPDSSGLATFMPSAMQGRGDFDVPVAIGGSAEYWIRAQAR